MRTARSLSTQSLVALLAVLSTLSLATAQDTTTAPAGPPTFQGRDRVQAPVVGRAGALLVLANGARLLIPAGLPIGTRNLAFAVARQHPRPAQVAPGFVIQGPTLSFDGAINATSNPIVVSLRASHLTERAGMRLVLAMEQAGVCTPTANIRLPNGLCSTWEVLEATYTETTGLIEASVATPGGFRMQFGWIPLPLPPG